MKFQIFVTTHSPYFVDLERFQSLRRIEKSLRPDGPMETKVRFTKLVDALTDVLTAYSRSDVATEDSSWARIKSILGVKGSEGFFSDAVILVEGQEDEAIICAYAESNVSLDSLGVSIIPAEGKTNIPQLLVLYSRLSIPTFVIFDADGNETKDKDAHTDTNEALLKLLGETPQKRPKTTVFSNGVVWENTFVDAIKSELGETAWNECYEKACEEYSMRSADGKKKFAVIRRTMGLALANGKSSSLLDTVWKQIQSRCNLA